MVGLHMIDNQIIERSSIQRVLEVFKENIADAAIHGVLNIVKSVIRIGGKAEG